MSHAKEAQRPIRAGVFRTPREAGRAVDTLLLNGFSRDEITLVCSEESHRPYFQDFPQQPPAGSRTPSAAAAGGAIGAALAGMVVASGAATGGVALLAVGGLSMLTGGVVGGLIGAMMTRGVEKEVAEYFSQAVQEGKILVAVDIPDADLAALARAEQLLSEAGAEPLALQEG